MLCSCFSTCLSLIMLNSKSDMNNFVLAPFRLLGENAFEIYLLQGVSFTTNSWFNIFFVVVLAGFLKWFCSFIFKIGNLNVISRRSTLSLIASGLLFIVSWVFAKSLSQKIAGIQKGPILVISYSNFEVSLKDSVSSTDLYTPNNLTPSLLSVSRKNKFMSEDMHLTCGFQSCIFGDISSNEIILLVGDKQMSQWLPTFEIIATYKKMKLLVFWTSCSIFTKFCRDRNLFWRLVSTYKPVRIVFSNKLQLGITPDDVIIYKNIVSFLKSVGVSKILFLSEIPSHAVSVPNKLLLSGGSLARCSAFVSQSQKENIALERLKVTELESLHIDTTTFFCVDGKCACIIDNILMYWDKEHMTGEYARYLVPAMHKKLLDINFL